MRAYIVAGVGWAIVSVVVAAGGIVADIDPGDRAICGSLVLIASSIHFGALIVANAIRGRS